MMIKKTLFYIESPFQLIQAYEIIKKKHLRHYKILIRRNRFKKNNEQLKNIKEIFQLKEAIFLRSTDIFKFSLFFIFLVEAFKANKVFFGDSNSYVYKFTKKIISHKSVLLDDGSSSLIDKNKNHKRFSIFENIENKQSNSFENLKKFIISKNKIKNSHSVIVGQNIVELGIASKEKYIRFLNQALKNANYKRIYIPHRYELDSNLNIYKKELDLKIVQLELPIELIEYELDIELKEVYSLYSTALFSLKNIYDQASLYSYNLRKENLLNYNVRGNTVSDIEKIYKLIEADTKIKLIEL